MQLSLSLPLSPLREIKKSIDKYLHTFYDLATGKQHVVRSFRNATTDEERILVFKRHPSFYRFIAGELKSWVGANYREIWLEEKPEWFTDRVLASIPKEFIPKEEQEVIAKIEEEGGRLEMKRASIVEGLLGAPPGSSSSSAGGKKTDEVGGGNKLARRLSLTGVVVPEAELERRKTEWKEIEARNGGPAEGRQGGRGASDGGEHCGTNNAQMGQTRGRQTIANRQSLRKSGAEGRGKVGRQASKP